MRGGDLSAPRCFGRDDNRLVASGWGSYNTDSMAEGVARCGGAVGGG